MWSIFEHLCLLIHIEFRQKQNSFSRRFHLKKKTLRIFLWTKDWETIWNEATYVEVHVGDRRPDYYTVDSLYCVQGSVKMHWGLLHHFLKKKKSGNAQSFRSLRVNLEKSRCCIPSTKANMLAESSLNDMWVRSSRGRSLYGRRTKPRNWTITASESPITW